MPKKLDFERERVPLYGSGAGFGGGGAALAAAPPNLLWRNPDRRQVCSAARARNLRVTWTYNLVSEALSETSKSDFELDFIWLGAPHASQSVV